MKTEKMRIGTRKVSKSGKYPVVSIPQAIVRHAGIKFGDEVEIVYNPILNSMTIEFKREKE